MYAFAYPSVVFWKNVVWSFDILHELRAKSALVLRGFGGIDHRAVRTGTLGEALSMFCEVDTFIPSPRVPLVTVLASIDKLTEFSPFLIQNG